MYLMIEENPNCAPDERMFAHHGEPVRVAAVHADPSGTGSRWYAISAVDSNGSFHPAEAIRIDDSSDGTAWLIFGAAWGLRLRPAESVEPWSLNDAEQAGVPFLVVDGSGATIRFDPKAG